METNKKVNRIYQNGLVLVPHVTDMRNGMFRPEVAWSKGSSSNIVFGELYDDEFRAKALALMTARSLVMTASAIERMRSELVRSLDNQRRLVEMLQTQIC